MFKTLLITALLGLTLGTTVNYPVNCSRTDFPSAPFAINTSSTTAASDLEYDLDFESHSEVMKTSSNNLYNNRSGGWGKITAKASSDTDDTITSFRVHSPAEFSVGSETYDVEV